MKQKTFFVLVSDQDEEQQQILAINLVFSNACEHFLEISRPLGLIIPLKNDQPAYYRYIQIHLYLIERILSYEQKTISSHLPLFSIQDETILSRSLSFIILLGLVLHFDEGTFLSIENCLKYSFSSVYLIKLKANLTHHNRMSYLNQTVTILMELMTNSNKNSFLIQRLCSNHLLELILSYLQLLYSPNLKYSFDEFLSNNFHENLNYLQINFSKIFIRQIMLLNRLLSTTVNSPVWLKNRCGDLLTSILINPNHHGIRQILETIVESTSPNDRLYTSVGKILSTCPKQLKPEEYFQCIKFQFIELIHDKRYMPIICISINQLYRKYSKLVEDELFSILFRPLISCQNQSSSYICTEEQLESFINDTYNLIIMIPNEQIRIYLYENYLNELINIYLALEKSLSSLKTKFFHILTIIFSSMNIQTCIEYFKRILFHFKFLYLKFLPDLSSIFNLMIDKNDENNLEIFCQLMIKILFSIENNDCLIVKIFLDLLQLLITSNQSSELFIWTENENQMNIKQFKIMHILKHILEYLITHIDIFVKNVDDTIRVIQV